MLTPNEAHRWIERRRAARGIVAEDDCRRRSLCPQHADDLERQVIHTEALSYGILFAGELIDSMMTVDGP
jgi:hypothetical protein